MFSIYKFDGPTRDSHRFWKKQKRKSIIPEKFELLRHHKKIIFYIEKCQNAEKLYFDKLITWKFSSDLES